MDNQFYPPNGGYPQGQPPQQGYAPQSYGPQTQQPMQNPYEASYGMPCGISAAPGRIQSL